MCDTRALITTKQTNDLHSCWIIYTKSDGRERLTVTDTKPVIMTSSGGSSNNPTDLTNNNNNNNNNSNHSNINNNSSNNNEIYSSNGLLGQAAHSNDSIDTSIDAESVADANADADADADGDVDAGCGFTEQSLAEILDPELQPEPPIPNNAESQAIFRDHRHMAREYLRVDTNLYYAQDFKDKLILQMDPNERKQKQELLRKIKDKEGLQSLYNNLQQQWEKLPGNRLAANHQRQPAPAVVSSSSNSQELTSNIAGGDSVENDGWVFIAPHHNA